jgi:hypothetical protein
MQFRIDIAPVLDQGDIRVGLCRGSSHHAMIPLESYAMGYYLNELKGRYEYSATESITKLFLFSQFSTETSGN